MFLVTIWNLDCKHLNSHWMTEKWSECTNFLLLSGFLQPQSDSSSFMAFENLLLNHISWSLFMKQNKLFHYALGTELPNENSQQYEHACEQAWNRDAIQPLFIHHHHWNIYSWQSWQKIDHSKLATRRQKNGFLHLFPFHPSSDLFSP